MELPGTDSAFGDGQFFIRDHEVGVDFQLEAQAGAGRAGAVGAVEAEGARGDLTQADAAVDAGKMLGEKQFLAIDDGDQHDAGAELQGRLHGIGDAALSAAPGPITSRSTTTSMVCFLFLSSWISSERSWTLPSTRTRA